MQEGKIMIDQLKRAIDKARSPRLKEALSAIAKLDEEVQESAFNYFKLRLIESQIKKLQEADKLLKEGLEECELSRILKRKKEGNK